MPPLKQLLTDHLSLANHPVKEFFLSNICFAKKKISIHIPSIFLFYKHLLSYHFLFLEKEKKSMKMHIK